MRNPHRGLIPGLAFMAMLASLPWTKPSLSISAFLPPDWAANAACRDLEPEEADHLFFPQRGGKGNAGRALCRRCPVSEQCLELALSQGEAFGIWGVAPRSVSAES